MQILTPGARAAALATNRQQGFDSHTDMVDGSAMLGFANKAMALLEARGRQREREVELIGQIWSGVSQHYGQGGQGCPPQMQETIMRQHEKTKKSEKRRLKRKAERAEKREQREREARESQQPELSVEEEQSGAEASRDEEPSDERRSESQAHASRHHSRPRHHSRRRHDSSRRYDDRADQGDHHGRPRHHSRAERRHDDRAAGDEADDDAASVQVVRSRSGRREVSADAEARDERRQAQESRSPIRRRNPRHRFPRPRHWQQLLYDQDCPPPPPDHLVRAGVVRGNLSESGSCISDARP